MNEWSPFLLARLQMAFTLGYHIVVASLGVGMPVLLLMAEGRYLKSGDPLWKILAQRWAKIFAVLFGVGAVSGTVLSFEMGLLWPHFMGRFGGAIGLPFTLEAFAFFLEAVFAGIYLYGWDKLSPRIHWLSGVPIAVSGFLSAFFVVTANAWMNTPQGFEMTNGLVTHVDPWKAMFNPAAWVQTTHMIVAAYMVSGFLVASYYAWQGLKGKWKEYHRRALSLSLLLGILFAPVQILVGDWAGRVVAKTQPAKLAAMEGQFKTEARAPLRIGGIPNEKDRRTRYALEIPGLASWLAYGDADAVVKGLDDFPPDEVPPTAVVHVAFQVMVAIGFFLLALSLFSAAAWLRRRRFPSGKIFLAAVALSGILSVFALEAGWIVTEVGRQPWIVYNIMRTREAVTGAPGVEVIFFSTLGIYSALTVGLFAVLRLLAKKPLPIEATDD